MVYQYVLWFFLADLLLFWGGWVGGWVVGWVGEIEDKVHLSPAEAEIGAELGKITKRNICAQKQLLSMALFTHIHRWRFRKQNG